MIHAVDSLRLLQGLEAAGADWATPSTVCLQVNTSNEPAKHGWSAEAILADAEMVHGLPDHPGRRADDDGGPGHRDE